MFHTLTKSERAYTIVAGLPRAQQITLITLQYANGNVSEVEYIEFYLSWTIQEQNKANNLISGIKSELKREGVVA